MQLIMHLLASLRLYLCRVPGSCGQQIVAHLLSSAGSWKAHLQAEQSWLVKKQLQLHEI